MLLITSVPDSGEYEKAGFRDSRGFNKAEVRDSAGFEIARVQHSGVERAGVEIAGDSS